MLLPTTLLQTFLYSLPLHTLLASCTPVPVPILGFGQTSTDSAPTPISNGTIESSFVRPAFFSRIAYCSTSSVLAQSCGTPCEALGSGVEILLAGGDDQEIPRYFVAHDPTSQSIVVAHQGTDPSQFLSLLNDAQILLVDLNETSFPNSPSGVSVHDGFQKTFDRTATEMLDAVQNGLTTKNVNKVLLTGHSLGAAVAVMDAMFLKDRLPDVSLTTIVFGLPRGGNQDWADFVDAQLGSTLTHITNRNDPVPTVPPRILDYQHPSGEVHINTDGAVVGCDGQENSACSDADKLLDASVGDHLGPYFDGIEFGSGACPT